MPVALLAEGCKANAAAARAGASSNDLRELTGAVLAQGLSPDWQRGFAERR